MSHTLTTEDSIVVKGARVHNLKNIDLQIIRDRLYVITGLSGSGKSSLAFNTLYADGQRRYVESLSAYARQFLGKVHRPDVDLIHGIPPAIAIEQKVNTRNPRSTVGTSTEIYDYMKLFYARVGKTYSPVSGDLVKRHSVGDVIDYIYSFNFEDTRVVLLSPHHDSGRSMDENFQLLLQQGFTRVEVNGEIVSIEDILASGVMPDSKDIFVLIDRAKVGPERKSESRIADSVETAFHDGKGECVVKIYNGKDFAEEKMFSNRFEADGLSFEEPTVHTFSFNNPLGACPACEGFGKVMGVDPDLVIPNKNLSVYEDAIACWRGDKMGEWKDQLIFNASKFDFPVHRPYYELTSEQKKMLWTGNQYFAGLDAFFKMVEGNLYKVQYRVMLSRYRGKTKCPTCGGTRLKPEASCVKIDGKSISDLVDLPIKELKAFFDTVVLDEHDAKIGERLLLEIRSRIEFLLNVGLGYLTLNRLSSSLSGGESQRINLATSLGSSLVGSLYILDEPSIGLHSRDTELLIGVLRHLQEIGNTVMVVEHDEDIMHAADEIIDIGPEAGIHGGEVVFQGMHEQLLHADNSLTAQYLTGKLQIPVPARRRSWNNSITIQGARENNLKNISVTVPLNVLSVVTGVSGSGKSTLIRKIFYPAVSKHLGGYGDKTGEFDLLLGDLSTVKSIEFVDQNPIGKSSRSNPVTYSKAYDEIRKLYAELPASKLHNFKPTHFSFNIDGGRCDECQGDGVIKVEMQFMADVELVCESCGGKRFKDDVLDVFYKEKNIYDVLDLSVDEAIDFFAGSSTLEKKIVAKLTPLQQVGLGYVKLGQASSTLSGGESQRIKLASFLGKDSTAESCLFVFDEPTTGLHFHDIRKLLASFDRLIEKGHSVLVIEHNMDVVKSADWIIDLGPEGGDAGGMVVFEGTPEDLVACEESYTGKYLKEKL